MSPEVSVILPIYNVEKYLPRCLDSILAQTFTDFEILCVDDCGKDGSMKIARQYQSRYGNKIRCIESVQNAGLGGARDKGIHAAAGEYIAFVDSDDTITEDYLEAYVRCAEKEQADIVAGGNCRITEKGCVSLPGMPEDPWYCWVNVSAWAKLFRTSFLRKNNIDFRGIRTYEDAPFIFRCLAGEPRVAVIRHEGYYYFQNPGSITTSHGKDRIHLYRQFQKDLAEMYSETVFPEKDREILAYVMASQLITNLLYNGQHAGLDRMQVAYREMDRFLKELDPDLRRNPFISLKTPVSEPRLNRQAAWLMLKIHRVGISYPVFALVSVLPRIR